MSRLFAASGLHPSIEQRVIQEIDAVTGGESLQVNHLEALTYTRQVLQEGIRLYPPAPLSFAQRGATCS